MSKKLFNLFVVAIFSLFSANLVLAAGSQSLTQPKTYIIKVTSFDTRQPNLPIKGYLLQYNTDANPIIAEVNQTTPWETTVTANYLRYVLSTDLNNPLLRIHVLERENGSEHDLSSAAGHLFDGNATSYNMSNGIAVFN